MKMVSLSSKMNKISVMKGGYVPTDGLIEPLDAYADLFGDAKRRKTAE